MRIFDENYNISNVFWEPYYILSKASIGQIIYTMLYIQDPTSYLYKKTNPIILQKIREITDFYQEKLVKVSMIDKNVAFYNLIVDLPRSINVDNEIHGKIKLSHARIGQLIYALKTRITFILNRPVPQINFKDTDTDGSNEDYNLYKISFNNMQKDMKELMDIVLEFEDYYVNFVKKKNYVNSKPAILKHIAKKN